MNEDGHCHDRYIVSVHEECVCRSSLWQFEEMRGKKRKKVEAISGWAAFITTLQQPGSVRRIYGDEPSVFFFKCIFSIFVKYWMCGTCFLRWATIEHLRRGTVWGTQFFCLMVGGTSSRDSGSWPDCQHGGLNLQSERDGHWTFNRSRGP